MDVVKVLLEAGVDKDRADTESFVPLHSASENGHAEVVNVLLQAGADKDKADVHRRFCSSSFSL